MNFNAEALDRNRTGAVSFLSPPERFTRQMDVRSEFFTVLDQLTLSEIEAKLPSWDADQLKWVEEYLQRRTIKPAEWKKGTPSTEPEATAVEMATKATTIATVALIIAIGAMIAAIAAGLVAFQALQFVSKG